MMKRIYILSFLFFLISVIGWSQTQSEYLRAANHEFETGNYSASVGLFENVLENSEYLPIALFRYAESLRMVKDYKKAASAYRKVLSQTGDTYPLARFWYAEMMKYLGDYKRASTAFNKFYKDNRTIDELKFYILKARYEKTVCASLTQEPAFEEPIELSLLDTSINSKFGEFSPFQNMDGRLYYSSYRATNPDSLNEYRSGVFSSPLEQSSAAENTDTVFFSDAFHYSISPSHYGREVFVTRCPIDPKQGSCELFLSHHSNGAFSEMQKLQGEVNMAGYNSRHPWFTSFNGKKFLVFASDRRGGFGGHDIWYCERKDELRFDDCKNAGHTVNTIDEEVSPFYYPGDTILFFSSGWHKSFGGFDIYKCKGDFEVWGPPENLGRPINTSYDELYYSFNDSTRNAFFVSNRPGGMAFDNATCCNDIYTYTLPYTENDSLREVEEERLRILRVEKKIETLRLLTPLVLYFDNDRPDPKSRDTISSKKYDELVMAYLNKEKKYQKEYTQGLKRKEKRVAQEQISALFVDDIEGNWNKLFQFVTLAEDLLAKGKKIEITLKAYSSPLNSADYNSRLAKRRISSLMNFFETYDDGILIRYLRKDQLRLKTISFGESESAGVISDDRSDKRNSVYSPNAARARKIVIEAVEIH